MKLKIALSLALLLSLGITAFAVYISPEEEEQIAAQQELLAQEEGEPVIEEDEPAMIYEEGGYAPNYIYNRGYRGVRRGPRRPIQIERRR